MYKKYNKVLLDTFYRYFNPYLEVSSYYSEELSKSLSLERYDSIDYPIEDNVIRTHTIEKGVNHVNFSATSGGKLPKMIFTSLAIPDAFNGDETESATMFNRNDMSKIELLVDNKTLPGSTVQMNDFILPYTKFHRECKLLPNYFVGELMTHTEFDIGNVMTAYDFNNIEQKNGWLTVKIDFDKAITYPLILIVYMIYDKVISFEKDGVVVVH